MDCLHSLASKPSAYWDRTDRVVRDWSTGQALPDYEGPCMVYSDMRGPLVMRTFLNKGERQWQEAAENQLAGQMSRSQTKEIPSQAKAPSM
jgi:hypothetical protein